MGDSWATVAEPVRCAHGTGATMHGRGQLRIEHGHRWARWLAGVFGLPCPSAAADTRLLVTSDASGERWSRTFDGRRMETRQYQSDACELAERFGLLEFRFRLASRDGSLCFVQRAAAFVCGPVRLPIPSSCAPHVAAVETAAGPNRVRINVAVSLPGIGPLITYDGVVEFEEARR